MKLRRMGWEGHVTYTVGKRGAYRILVSKPEGKKPFGSPRRRWEDNIKKDRKESVWRAWTRLLWLRIGTSGRFMLNVIINFWVP
jgi:hypothetical protein